jgi:hypothetical protein
MKQLPLSKFHQIYSRSFDDRPSNVWAIDLHSGGILSDVIERSSETSTGWLGWGFLITGDGLDYTTGCLLFEREEDAVMAKLVYGEQLYAN